MGLHVERVLVKLPDGGWGWMVLLSCFIITEFSYAFPKAVSVYFKELMKDFQVGYSDTAWISSIMLAMHYGTGPVSSILVNKFGCRPVMLIGGLLASVGMVLASFTTNILELYLTAGVETGLGLALNFQPSLSSYFDKRRPLANGLAAAGSPVFLSALSPLGQVLQDRFGWRGGFLIMGGLLLNCCTCGAIMRPLASRRQVLASGTSRDPRELREMLPMKEGRTAEAYSNISYSSCLGLALNFQPSLSSYFDKRRPLANGLTAAGSPVFLSALSPLGQVLQDRFGWRGGFLIMGGLLLNCCTCGAIMRPLASRRQVLASGTSRDPRELREMLPMKEGRTAEAERVGKNKVKKQKKQLLDFSVFRDRVFVIYTVTKFITVSTISQSSW
ncbi:UNVERIFIED_CONTAM: hypothetical protein FKN15_013898 [Acipenser sinensis]